MKIKPWTPLVLNARELAIEAVIREPTIECLKAKDDLGFFGEYVLGFTPASHHQEWLKAICRGDSNEVLNLVAGNNLRISAPRGSAKTTWVSATAAWIIGHNPYIRIALISYAEEVALSISVAIKSIVESEKYQNVFPYIRKSKRWRDKAWLVDRHLAGVDRLIKDPTLFAVGSAGAIASRRADLIIVDDPIRSSKDIDNVLIRQAMVRWWSEVLHPILVPGGRVIVLSTRYRVDDIHGTTFSVDKGWEVISQKAIVDGELGEESFWPEYMYLDFLKRKRDENPITFASQYQNEPFNEDSQVINPDWIVKGLLPDSFDEIAIGVDLAASKKESADYTALVVVGRGGGVGVVYYVIDWRRGRWSINESILELLKLVDLYQDSATKLTFQVESVAYQAVFVEEFRRRAIESGISVRVDGVRLKGDKLQRLHGVSGLFESGLLIFNDAIAFGTLLDELLQFGYGAHDDLVDAMVYGLLKIFKKKRTFEVSGY